MLYFDNNFSVLKQILIVPCGINLLPFLNLLTVLEDSGYISFQILLIKEIQVLCLTRCFG